jgi:hypothetical protein
MDDLPKGSEMFKELLRMSWRSLILGAAANSHAFFTPRFLDEAERCSPFRFAFLHARHKRLTSLRIADFLSMCQFPDARRAGNYHGITAHPFLQSQSSNG